MPWRPGCRVFFGHLYRNQKANYMGLQEISEPITANSRQPAAVSVHVEIESEILRSNHEA